MKTEKKLNPVELYLLEHEKKILDGSAMKMLYLEDDKILKQILQEVLRDKSAARA
ncbi:MAG: hypothetical protein V3S48_06530 [Candidatus Neomarinimicrobiota bacterium]